MSRPTDRYWRSKECVNGERERTVQANVLGTRFILERSERERDLRRHGISSAIERPALSERDREIAAHGDKEYAQRCKRERERWYAQGLLLSHLIHRQRKGKHNLRQAIMNAVSCGTVALCTCLRVMLCWPLVYIVSSTKDPAHVSRPTDKPTVP